MNTLRYLLGSALLVVLGMTSLSGQTLRWERLAGPEGGNVRSLTRTPDGTLLAVLNGEGLYRSNDGGASWELLPSQSATDEAVAIHSTLTGTLLLATPDSTLFGSILYRSTDMGENWNAVNDDIYWRIPLANGRPIVARWRREGSLRPLRPARHRAQDHVVPSRAADQRRGGSARLRPISKEPFVAAEKAVSRIPGRNSPSQSLYSTDRPSGPRSA